ncbi:MAG: hypothetical protein NTW19_00855 [Planctomycetota bacterium]|nr:hypothetical protein [Planctomycetota bacterium]
MLPPVNDIDFGNSYLRFSTLRVEHTPRMRLDGVCTFLPASGAPRSYFLSCSCVCERMYVPTGLIHQPIGHFNIVINPGVEFLMFKRHASAARDVRSAHRLGEVMPTHDGKGATMASIDAHPKRFARVSPIRTPGEFREALLGDRTINGRTTFLDADGQTRVVLDYPAATTNVGNREDVWQVDAGPLLFPVFPAGTGRLEVERFDLAYLVYNRFDYAEAAVGGKTPLDPNGADGPATHHFTAVRPVTCRNELFAAD